MENKIKEDNRVIDIALAKFSDVFLLQTCISVIIWQVPFMIKKLRPRVQSRLGILTDIMIMIFF